MYRRRLTPRGMHALQTQSARRGFDYRDVEVADVVESSAHPSMASTSYDPIELDREDEGLPSTEANAEWFMDKLRTGTLSYGDDKPRILIGDPTVAGTAGDGYDYAHFDEDFCHDRMYTHVLRYDPHDEGPELMEQKRLHALNAVESNTTYSVPKWKMIHPSRMEKTHRLATTESAERNVYDDSRTTHYVDYDRFRIALEQRATVREQQEASGVAGTLISPIVSFFEASQVPTEGAGDKLTQMKCHLIPAEAIPYPELAAYLLTRPTNLLRQIYRKDPITGAHLREDLEKIATLAGEEDMTEAEKRVMSTVIRKHLDEMEVTRIFDPLMIQYVQEGDAKHLEVGAMRDTYERIYHIACGEVDEEGHDIDKRIIFPLAVHMRDRHIPLTVENVIGEMDALLQTREILEKLSFDFGRQLESGGPQAFLDHASEEEREVLDSVGKEVIAMLMPGNCRATTFLPIYGEEERSEADRVAETMFGPRLPGGLHHRAGFSSGGYYQAGAKTIDPPEQEVAPFDRNPAQQQVTFSPYTEAREFLRQTRLRKFIVPSY